LLGFREDEKLLKPMLKALLTALNVAPAVAQNLLNQTEEILQSTALDTSGIDKRIVLQITAELIFREALKHRTSFSA
jgi:hypothetical protein